MLGWLSNIFGTKSAPAAAPPAERAALPKRSRIDAAYDAAQTTSTNSRHWKQADLLSASAANSREVRETLRSRARYEALESNSFAKGIVLTLANDVIGTGPRLQVLTDNSALNQGVERAFAGWAKSTHLARKLRTMRIAKCVDGETFAHKTTNRKLFGVQLDLALREADQITDPAPRLDDPHWVDGIEIDEAGQPAAYHVLDQHPGDPLGAALFDTTRIPAEDMIHLFRHERPGQYRGVPEITTALPLFAQLRRYTLAVLGSAEVAAKFSAVMTTRGGAPQDDGTSYDPSVEPFDVVDIDYDMLTSLPYGWDMKQFKPEQPTTNYKMFRDALINEIARCLNMPLNIARGDSSDYNYASGRLDHQMYFKSILVERSEWECACLDRIFQWWLDEALFVLGLLPVGLPDGPLPHQWFWDGREHVDPAKEATAQATRLASMTTTLSDEYARQGLDWEVQLRQIARERALMAELGIAPAAPPAPAADDEQDEDDDEPNSATDGDSEGDGTDAESSAADAAAAR